MQRRTISGTWLSVVVFAFASLIGCSGCDTNPPAPVKPAAGNGADPGHSHDAKGPHSGKVMAIGNEEYHAEFVHEDASGKVTVYLLDKDIKVHKDASSAAEVIIIEGKTGTETKIYELAAVNRTAGDMPTAHQFEVVDKELIGLLSALGGTNKGTLKVNIGGKDFAQNISFDDHGHAH